jgi:hypothetical protein
MIIIIWVLVYNLENGLGTVPPIREEWLNKRNYSVIRISQETRPSL